MAKRLSLDNQLARIKQLSTEPVTEQTQKELTKCLQSKNNVVVAKAVKAVCKLALSRMQPELQAAFERFMKNPVKTDPACLAKTAIAETLYDLELQLDGVFIAGIRHIQMEPVYGGRTDTAAKLRGVCARALAAMNYPDIHFLLTNLLTDSELQPRMAAVNALSFLADREAELLLRLKVLTGDAEPEVMGLCFSGLLQINPIRSNDFVAQFIQQKDVAVATEAAMALGESRSDKAFDILSTFYSDNFMPQVRKMLILPIALLRQDSAFDFLLEQLEFESLKVAEEIIQAFRLFPLDHEKTNRIEQVLLNRNIPELLQLFANTLK